MRIQSELTNSIWLQIEGPMHTPKLCCNLDRTKPSTFTHLYWKTYVFQITIVYTKYLHYNFQAALCKGTFVAWKNNYPENIVSFHVSMTSQLRYMHKKNTEMPRKYTTLIYTWIALPKWYCNNVHAWNKLQMCMHSK